MDTDSNLKDFPGRLVRIALFHTTLPESGRKPGGVEVAVHRLANALSHRADDHVTVLSLTAAPDDARYEHVQLFRRANWLARVRLARLLVLPALLNFVRLARFDVVHLHGDDWFLFRRGSFASVRTMHGSALEEARSATSWRRRLMQYGIYPLEHLAARLATCALAVGPKTASIYHLDALADNGVDDKVFRPGRKTIAPTVLFVGTWEGRKRGSFLFDHFVSDVAPRLPEARLVMVCDHCEEHPQVEWERFPDDAQLAALYRLAWVFAYPSVYEGFGIPYVEAMSSGTVVLCSDNDGARYVLENGRYGVVASDDAFGERLFELLTDEGARAEYEQMGLERARRFAWSNVAAAHRAIYEGAVQRTGNPIAVVAAEQT